MPKCVPIDYFLKKHKNAEEKKESRNSNRCEVLIDNDDDERHEEKK